MYTHNLVSIAIKAGQYRLNSRKNTFLLTNAVRRMYYIKNEIESQIENNALSQRDLYDAYRNQRIMKRKNTARTVHHEIAMLALDRAVSRDESVLIK